MKGTPKGVTLVELIIALGITVVVGGLLLVILVNNTGFFYQQSSKVNGGMGINDALGKIRSDIRSAKSVAQSYPIGLNSDYISGVSELVLQIPSLDPAGNILSNVYDYTVYSVEQGQVHRKVFPDTNSSRKNINQILTSNVDSVVFEYLDSSGNQVPPSSAVKVKSTLILKQRAGADTIVQTATSEANLRNN